MPKQVDHVERRREIAAAVGRLAARRGLQGVSFREVAAEAGMSVALVQHYVGTKEQLLVAALDGQSAQLDAVIGARLGRLDADAGPLERLRVLAGAFLAADRASRDAMLLYHGFAGAALTDPALRRADAFRNGHVLTDALAGLVRAGKEAGEVAADVDPAAEGWALLALVLGLSLGVLLEQLPAAEAEAVLDAHLSRLRPSAHQRVVAERRAR